jgi:threonine/homoserine/homoserine lactone efflux protein
MAHVPDGSSLLAFIATALVVLVIPGPGVLYIVARSLAQGHRAGVISVLGLSAGALVHVLAATAGLSAILLASAAAFSAVKLLGAAYLIYLGLRTLCSSTVFDDVVGGAPRSAQRLFTDGVVVSVLNPKIAVFFVAFLPQFVDANAGHVTQQLLALGLIYVVLALVTDGSYALLAGSLRHVFGSRFVRGPLPRYASGAVYLGLGVTTALTDRRH